ncbi:MAG: type II toxin-antitoxin system RelE/ParE family toxin [Betaproteobacteria bacterium]|nr:type II toxin-antitoxin system RelE/ParE family toxin [Betaproteobacteria bacterium]
MPDFRGAGIGEYFLDSLFADIDALVLFAGIRLKPDGNLHRTIAKRFPFVIYDDPLGKPPPSWLCSTAARIPRRSRNGLQRR